MKFLHAADLHIDSPLRGLHAQDGAPVERLRGATRQAFVALIDLAVRRQVNLVILAGDLYDGDWVDFRTGLFVHEQLARLAAHGIFVFVVRGNHDAESVISRQLPRQDHVHVFSSRVAQTRVLAELGVAVHGRSFPNRAVTEDLVPGYPAAVRGCFNIGVLHTSLSGSPDHGTYAPTRVDLLAATGYDYLALGHIHARQVVRESQPRIVFPGNLQGRHALETGPKGCEIVTVQDGQLAQTEFVALDVVRWHVLTLPCQPLTDIDALRAQFLAALAVLLAGDRSRLHVVRVQLRGESVLHQMEAVQPGLLEAALQAGLRHWDGPEVWIERVLSELTSPLDRAAASERPDALGEVVRLVDRLAGDDTTLRQWALAALESLPALPVDLGDARPDRLTPDQWRALLADAEAMVLAQLGAGLPDSVPVGGVR
ncbi:DNA repair exonuclease [Sphaerotilus montanus]|uniref:DNA repair exonuclease SbcCD nuclease subunit n=1 Tax=Sphaerotilus montanus TaxID=522889 RepID=A0A7Y9UE47_9BURK|nr:DNA repair exonuclease [Sphaerotilus montanus]NYG35294.1 DNA repair exonuclease SbcCD nuclease subunit [Sphaerotilus montanus]NZD56839.1 DNA repair exonuclease [Sphaerotilus montanus]